MLVEADEHGICPAGGVAPEVVGREDHAVDTQELLGQRAAIDALGALLGERLERLDETRLHEQLSGLQHAVFSDEELTPPPEREDVAEHDQRALVHLGERDAGVCERERRLDQPLPRKPAEPLPELAERGGKPRDGARRGADRVHDDFLPEADRDLGEIALLGGHGREAVQVPDA